MSFRILVTGSSGFIGSAVISALVAAGHHVRAASRRPGKAANQNHVEWVELPDLENEVDWEPLVAGMDIVLHLAAIAHRSHVDDSDYARANRVARRLRSGSPAGTAVARQLDRSRRGR